MKPVHGTPAHTRAAGSLVTSIAVAIVFVGAPPRASAQSNTTFTYTSNPFSIAQCTQNGYSPTACQTGNLTASVTLSGITAGSTGTVFSANIVSFSISGLGQTITSSTPGLVFSYSPYFQFRNGSIIAWSLYVNAPNPNGAVEDISLSTVNPYPSTFEEVFVPSPSCTPALCRTYMVGFVNNNPGMWTASPPCPVNVSLAFGAATGFGPEYVTATFKANTGTLTSYAQACGFSEFTWQQVVTNWPCPGVLKANPASVSPQNLCADGSLTASLQHPFSDPPNGGYTFPPQRAQDDGNTSSYPFYYPSLYYPSPNYLSPAAHCTAGVCPPFPFIVDLSGTTLSFVDAPAHTTLPGVAASANPAPGTYVAFSTSLVGINVDQSGTLLSTTPLKTWTWNSTFNGTAGGAVQASTVSPIDPGSGSGGATITSINGVLLTIVPSTQIATTASGLAYSRVTQTFNGTVKITNISASAISTPSNGLFQILFTALPTGVTLANAGGAFNGSPYVTVPAVTSLAAGQSTTVSVQFKNSSNATINFTPVVFSGSF